MVKVKLLTFVNVASHVINDSVTARERNDAVSKLNLEMKNLEKLEKERRDMLVKIDELSMEQQTRKSSLDMNKNVGDLNMKLKLEIGTLKGENEGLIKKNDEIRREIGMLEDQIQVCHLLI